MPSVLLDTWTFEQSIYDEAGIRDEALNALKTAQAEKQWYVSVLSYAAVRENSRIKQFVSQSGIKELDALLRESGNLLSVDFDVVSHLQLVTPHAKLQDRLIAATALARGLILLTEYVGLQADGLETIISRPPRVVLASAHSSNQSGA